MTYTLHILGYAITALVTIHIFLRSYQLYIGNGMIKGAITDHYLDKGYSVLDISRLSVTDRIKYGVPISILWIYTYYFSFYSGKIDYVRKVELSNSDKEYIKYVELRVSKKKIISFKEFESFEY